MGMRQGKSYVLLSLAMSVHFEATSARVADMLSASIHTSMSLIWQARLDIATRLSSGTRFQRLVVVFGEKDVPVPGRIGRPVQHCT